MSECLSTLSDEFQCPAMHKDIGRRGQWTFNYFRSDCHFCWGGLLPEPLGVAPARRTPHGSELRESGDYGSLICSDYSDSLGSAVASLLKGPCAQRTGESITVALSPFAPRRAFFRGAKDDTVSAPMQSRKEARCDPRTRSQFSVGHAGKSRVARADRTGCKHRVLRSVASGTVGDGVLSSLLCRPSDSVLRSRAVFRGRGSSPAQDRRSPQPAGHDANDRIRYVTVQHDPGRPMCRDARGVGGPPGLCPSLVSGTPLARGVGNRGTHRQCGWARRRTEVPVRVGRSAPARQLWLGTHRHLGDSHAGLLGNGRRDHPGLGGPGSKVACDGHRDRPCKDCWPACTWRSIRHHSP